MEGPLGPERARGDGRERAARRGRGNRADAGPLGQVPGEAHLEPEARGRAGQLQLLEVPPARGGALGDPGEAGLDQGEVPRLQGLVEEQDGGGGAADLPALVDVDR